MICARRAERRSGEQLLADEQVAAGSARVLAVYLSHAATQHAYWCSHALACSPTYSTNQALWCKYELAVENNGRWVKAGKTHALLNPKP